MTFGKLLFDQKNYQGNYCLSPFIMIEVTVEGDIRMCGCGGWMPITIGNIKQHSLRDLLSTQLANDIRQSVITGTYQYCNEYRCGVINNNLLNTRDTLPQDIVPLLQDCTQFLMPTHISLQGDRTCNLSCPSCRTAVIKTSNDQKQEQENIGRLVYKNLFCEPTDKKITLEMSGSGEFFASDMLMSFVNAIDTKSFPNVKIHIGSNGLLAPERWHRIKQFEHLIEKVTVSIDAATANTYETIRRGGRWPMIVSAMQFLQTQKNRLGFDLHTRMIVQQGNFKEMCDFYHWCQQFGVDLVEYSRLANWFTWPMSQFKNHDVFDAQHAEHQSALVELCKVKILPNTWFSGL